MSGLSRPFFRRPHSSSTTDEESEELQDLYPAKKRFRSNSWEGCSMDIVPEEDTVSHEASASPVENETDSDTASEIEMKILSTHPRVSKESEYHICSHIPYLEINLYAKAGDSIEVSLCKVYNPDDFFFQLGEFQILFTNLLKRMMTFYSINLELPQLPEDDINVGQICAVNYSKLEGERVLWYRAEINEIGWGSQVLVNLVDFGKTVAVFRNDLKYLYEDFGALPRQAFSGSLAYIRPANGMLCYTEPATNRFINLTFEKELLARIVSINEEEYSVGMALSSINEEGIQINDILVEEGHAELD